MFLRRHPNWDLYQTFSWPNIFLGNRLKEKGISGVTVSRGIEGYGADKVLHAARLIESSSDLPMILEIVDVTEKIDPLILEICAMALKGLVFAADIEVYKLGKEQ